MRTKPPAQSLSPRTKARAKLERFPNYAKKIPDSHKSTRTMAILCLGTCRTSTDRCRLSPCWTTMLTSSRLSLTPASALPAHMGLAQRRVVSLLAMPLSSQARVVKLPLRIKIAHAPFPVGAFVHDRAALDMPVKVICSFPLRCIMQKRPHLRITSCTAPQTLLVCLP